ncbi:MAG: WYL domain-containing protein, partial [Oscillospiraceae bacterium]|nr:WYL domain-containing protein [Oscillospiraceae bacterium]
MENTKLKLLRVLDILNETDEDHPITANEIVARLKLYCIDAERKSVLRDIAALQNYGYDIL